jgi:phosphonatase-like hydrolase
MQKIRLVVFDIAGTTVRDKGNVAVAFMNAFKQYGLELPAEEVNLVMGFRKVDAIRSLLDKFYPDLAGSRDELISNIHNAFTENMVQHYKTDPELQPLPYATEIFSMLRQQGVKIGLNTGFTKVITDVILERLGWNTNMIDAAVSSDEVPEGRPAPYMIRSFMKKFNIDDAAAVAKVGDTEVDVQEGRNASCGLVVSVTTGAYTRKQLESYSPDAVIDSLQELPSILQLN